MSLQINISGATPKSGKSLCTTCKYATLIKGQNCEEIILCHLFAKVGNTGPVPFRVSECGNFHPVNILWLHEMEAMAWKVEARKRGPVGFEKQDASTEMEVVITKPRSKESYQMPLADPD